MSDNVSQDHLAALGKALPDDLTIGELLALILCILKGYELTDEDIVDIGNALAKFPEMLKAGGLNAKH